MFCPRKRLKAHGALALAMASLVAPLSAQKLMQTSVRGLLVVQLPNGKHAGSASQLNATVVPTDSHFEVRFNQAVGEMMSSSVKEVTKYLSVQYQDEIPEGKAIELGFADKYTPKDGPSAAVACALLGDSILSGDKLDPKFAVTGDMTATGAVQPVGGVPAKVRGAVSKGDAEIIAIPENNAVAMEDEYIISGLEYLYAVQIFTVKEFKDAKALAVAERAEDVQKSIDEFKMVQKALQKNENYVKHPKVLEKLREIYKLTPNCLSAKLLLLHAAGNGPRRLSAAGSLHAVDSCSDAIYGALQNGSFQNVAGNSDVIFKTLSQLQRVRRKLDKRTVEYCDAVLDIGQWIKLRRNDKVLSNGDIQEINSRINKLKIEADKLRSNSTFMEEILGE
ncbi:Lon protease [Rubritalea halochordaticola]|uniref:Lon protease n=1 Tax=Rubritalea halochordaticola TaxID=714537 RepID=A0ABP9V1G1_9BACT